MSRVAKAAISYPSNAEFSYKDGVVKVKGPKGELQMTINPLVDLTVEGSEVRVKPKENTKKSWAMAGTMRALVNNMVIGVTDGFEKRLELIGVGYRVQAQGKKLTLSLGYSHPIDYQLPAVVEAEVPANTKLVLKSADKQVLGQVAAEIRALRPPEPYKGKGIRYEDETVIRKETKKK